MIEIFKYSKFADIFIYLLSNKVTYINKISRELDITFSYTSICIKKMIKQGLAEENLKGRNKYIKLTKKGKTVAKKIFELKELMR